MKKVFVLLIAMIAFAVSSVAAGQQSPADIKKEQAELAKMTASYKTAKAAYLKSPNNEKLKKTYVKATVELGFKTMYANSLTPKQKYPGSLKLFHEALKIDPNQQEAKMAADTIEAIYRKRHQPIPKDGG